MSTHVLRAALTQTVNAYAPMPERAEDLPQLAGQLAELRRANVAHHLTLIEKAAAAGAQLIGLGELFSAPYFALERQPMWRELAEDARSGPTVSSLRQAARDLGLLIVAPIYELDAASGLRFNTAVILDEQGEILGSYRKTHIPTGANEQGSFHETFYYERGDGRQLQSAANISSNPHFPVFQTSHLKLGVATCYDRHFEGVMSTLAGAGAELVLCPSVTFGEQSRRLWEHEFQTDAMRQRIYIGGSNRCGSEPPHTIEYFGQSRFVGPDGLISNLSKDPELIICDLDLDALARSDRSGWDLRRDRRADIYGS